MRKYLLFVVCASLLVSLAPLQAEEGETEDISGTVRVIRTNPETEIFFTDRTDSVIVPQGTADGNKIIKMSVDSIKTKKPISMTIDPVSRRFVSLPGSKKTKAVEAQADSESEIQTLGKSISTKKASPVFKEIPSDNAK